MDWFRSWHGAPTDTKWLLIGRKAGVAPGIVSALFWALLDHASQAGERGCVSDFDIETYAVFSGFDEDDVAKVMAMMIDKGVIVDGMLTAWERRQPKEEDLTRKERQARWRERKKERRQEATTVTDDDRRSPSPAVAVTDNAADKRRGDKILSSQDWDDSLESHRRFPRPPLPSRQRYEPDYDGDPFTQPGRTAA